MQWVNLPPDEKLDLENFVNGYRTIIHVGKEKALVIGLVLNNNIKLYVR